MLAWMVALLSGLIWGGADFVGGLASRRAKSAHVLIVGGAIGFVFLLVLAFVWGEALPSARSVGWGIVAGVCGMLGLSSLYHGLAHGRASIVAPTSTIVTVAIPVLYVALTMGLPGPLKLAGFGLAVVGVWLVAQNLPAADEAQRGSGLRIAVLAGLGFGLFFVFIGFTDEANVFGSLAAARVATVAVSALLLLVRRETLSRASLGPYALASGVLDATGNALYLVSKQYVRQDVAVVLGSLYPISTILLSYFFLKEKITPLQWLGVAVCAVAVAMIVA
jgi:drug/metabolite transporter (DMT)-like permease